MKVGDVVKTIKTVARYKGLKGIVDKITKYGEVWIRIYIGNKYIRKGQIVHIPKHLLKKI